MFLDPQENIGWFIEENKIYQKINSHEITQIIMEAFKEGITQGISSGINHLVKDKQNENSSVEQLCSVLYITVYVA